MTSSIGKYAALALSGLVFVPTISAAASSDASTRGTDVDLSLGVEHYRWQEFDANGVRLLSEHGPRATLSGRIELDTGLRPLLVRVLGNAYAGVVDYDGQIQGTTSFLTHTFVSSETTYRGGQAELQIGYSRQTQSFSALELFLGAGVEGWSRDISGSVDAGGSSVSGFREDYTVYYGRIGLGFEETGNILNASFHVGAKLPYTVDEKVVISGVPLTLHPDGKWSAFADYRLTLQRNFLEFYYEGLRFDPSPVKNTFFQPESTVDSYGIRLGREF